MSDVTEPKPGTLQVYIPKPMEMVQKSELDAALARAEHAERERDELRVDGARLIRDYNEAKARADAAEKRAAAAVEAMKTARNHLVGYLHTEECECEDDYDARARDCTCGKSEAVIALDAALSPDAGQGFVPRAELERAQAERDDLARECDDWRAKSSMLHGTLSAAGVQNEKPLMERVEILVDQRDEWRAKAGSLEAQLLGVSSTVRELNSQRANATATIADLRRRLAQVEGGVK